MLSADLFLKNVLKNHVYTDPFESYIEKFHSKLKKLQGDP